MVLNGWKPVQLPATFMLTALLGLVISGVWVLPQSTDWGVSFLIFFTLMFIASLLSITYAPVMDSTKRKLK
jgi:hypothetical protein